MASKGKGLTEAEIQALRLIAKRDWPAGEPRTRWLHVSTARRLFADGFIVELNSPIDARYNSPVVGLTEAGRLALQEAGDA